MSVSLTKSKSRTSEHGKQYFFDEKVQRFQNKVYKYFAFLLGGSKSFLLLFVYEHAHLTADYRGRDLASLPYGEGKLTRISFTASLQRKDR